VSVQNTIYASGQVGLLYGYMGNQQTQLYPSIPVGSEYNYFVGLVSFSQNSSVLYFTSSQFSSTISSINSYNTLVLGYIYFRSRTCTGGSITESKNILGITINSNNCNCTQGYDDTTAPTCT
jgi:hypothetical protein